MHRSTVSDTLANLLYNLEKIPRPDGCRIAGAAMIFRQIKTVVAAVRAVYADSGFAMAGAVAFSFVLSLFPFCIFLGALAGVFGGEERAQEGIKQLFEIVPKPVAEALAPEVMEVMGRSRYDLLTYG